MTTSHTPGPWKFTTHFEVVMDDGDVQPLVAAVNASDASVSHERATADGRLIAAAPELLAALEAVLGYEDDRPAPGTRGAEIYAGAQAVIARAKGDA